VGERGGFEQTHSAQHCAVARAREHLPAPKEEHAECGLEEVRSQRRHPHKTRMRSGRRTVRAAALRLDGTCLSVRGDAGEDLDALKEDWGRLGSFLCSCNAAHEKGEISLVSPCARETRTRDRSYFQGGGARTRAHVWTDPGCS